eukprot:11205970-Lingulodinium_polyedra.AAC.1
MERIAVRRKYNRVADRAAAFGCVAAVYVARRGRLAPVYLHRDTRRPRRWLPRGRLANST